MIRHFFLVLDLHQLLLASLCWRSQALPFASPVSLLAIRLMRDTGNSQGLAHMLMLSYLAFLPVVSHRLAAWDYWMLR